MHPRYLLAAALAAPLLSACDQGRVLEAPTSFQASVGQSEAEPGLTIYGLGALRRATPKTPCRTGPYRQFDFWVGDWVVPNPAGGVGATNRIEVQLDGCAVIENWSPVNGLRGRSLNSYDAETGHWHQTWVTEAARPFQMAGGLRPDGVMDMTGVRRPWFGGPDWIDHYTWTAVDADHVVQAFTFDAGATHFEGQIPYTRSASLPPTTSPGGTRCSAGNEAGEMLLLDFLLGRWKVAAANGLELGTSVITVDPTLSGCLIEEGFATRKGYRALGWLYYDPVTNLFYRSYVDGEGSRLELRGAPTVDPLVLEGMEPLPGAPSARVRVTWSSVSSNQLRQTWEVSKDGGASWRAAQTLIFERQ